MICHVQHVCAIVEFATLPQSLLRHLRWIMQKVLTVESFKIHKVLSNNIFKWGTLISLFWFDLIWIGIYTVYACIFSATVKYKYKSVFGCYYCVFLVFNNDDNDINCVVLLWRNYNHSVMILWQDQLGQDVFLIGPPGPLRRNVAMMYLVCFLSYFE